MIGKNYDKALALADDDPDILDEVHSILMKDGLSEEAYAKVFAYMFFENKDPEERISCSSVEKVWKKGKQVLSDVKLLSALSQCCDLIRYYSLASWDNCVFSAWATKREVTKAEKEMDAFESYSHAKNIVTAAAPLMENNDCESSINWAENDGDEDFPILPTSD